MDSYSAKTSMKLGGKELRIASLMALEKRGWSLGRLPFCMRILLENLLRREDGAAVTAADIEAVANWDPQAQPSVEIAFMPARVLLQDFTGVPAIVDLAAMRDAMRTMGGDPKKINPLQPAELVIDHSVQVDEYGTAAAFLINKELEFERNGERYGFLKWGQKAFDNFKVVPPGTGIVHQVNLEYLGRVVMVEDAGRRATASLSGHTRRYRFPHHHDQRPGNPRLGCGRDRSRGCHARPAYLHAGAASRRVSAGG